MVKDFFKWLKGNWRLNFYLFGFPNGQSCLWMVVKHLSVIWAVQIEPYV